MPDLTPNDASLALNDHALDRTVVASDLGVSPRETGRHQPSGLGLNLSVQVRQTVGDDFEHLLRVRSAWPTHRR